MLGPVAAQFLMFVNHCWMSAMLWWWLVLILEIAVVRLTLRCVSPRALVLWDVFFSSYMLFQYCSVCCLCYFPTLQRGSTKESCVMNRAFILLASAPLLHLLSVADRAGSLCLALSRALYMDIQMHFFSSQHLTLIRSPLCSWASLLTLCVFFILASSWWEDTGYDSPNWACSWELLLLSLLWCIPSLDLVTVWLW